MEISNLPPSSSSKATDAQPDILSRLQQLGSIQARVLSIDNGQALLSTRLGEITGSNALRLKVGETIQIKLEGDKQNIVLKVTPSQDQVTLLQTNKYLKLLALLNTNRPTSAVVIKQQNSNALLQIGTSKITLPLIPQLKAGQILNITNRVDIGKIEIKPVNHQQILKSALIQLMSSDTRSPTSSKLLPLLQLLSTSLKANSGQNSQSLPTTAAQDLPGLITPGNSPPKAIQSLATGLELLTRILPQIGSLDQRTIQKWVEYATGSASGNKPEKGASTLNPFSVLHQLPKTDQGLALLLQLLIKPGPEQAEKNVKQRKETTLDSAQLGMTQLRDAVKSADQSLNQLLFQQTSLRLQQELQQPVAFNLNLPYLEQQSVKSLQLKIRQKSKQSSPDRQAWEIRLSFEFGLLGLISTHVSLDGNTLSTNFWAVEESTKIKIENALPDFKHQLVNSGFDLGNFFCYLGVPSNDDKGEFNPMPDSLLDIKV